jgi:transcriptional regulator with XRE-family HTH domain
MLSIVYKIANRFGERIRLLRRKKGMTQEQLEEKSRVHTTYISEIEHGHSSPTLTVINRLARGLGVPLWEIFIGMEIPSTWPTIEQIRKKGYFRKKPRKCKSRK